MALTVTSGLTEYNDCDANTGWTVGATANNEYNHPEGTNCLSDDIDVATSHFVGPTMTAVNMSTTKYTIYAWMNCLTAGFLDIKSNGGLRLVAEDSSGNQSYWYVGGSDTYFGGWEVFCCNTNASPNANSGTACDLTDVVQLGVGFKGVTKSKLPENCLWDWVRYGSNTTPALTIYGTNTTTDDGWSEVLSDDETGGFGIIQAIPGGYKLKGLVQFGDSAGTNTTDFTDTGTTLVWDNMPVGDSFYGFTVEGNGTGTTDVLLGAVVGSGDDRQGISGNSINTAGPGWSWKSATDIADIDTVCLYGCTLTGAKGGIDLDDGNKSCLISTQFVNCGVVTTGSTNDGAEILACFFIDPEGLTNNYGLQFDQTPVTGTMTTKVKKCNFITSGTPTTQYMTVFPYSGDYTVAWADMVFFGSYTSGTLWHGLNTGTDADVTIGATGTTNAATAEFSSTDVTGPDTGSVTVSASVPLTITVKDKDSLALLTDVQTSIFLKDSPFTQLMNEDTVTGVATESYSGTPPVDVVWKCRKSDNLDSPRYRPASGIETVTTDGLNITVLLEQNSTLR